MLVVIINFQINFDLLQLYPLPNIFQQSFVHKSNIICHVFNIKSKKSVFLRLLNKKRTLIYG